MPKVVIWVVFTAFLAGGSVLSRWLGGHLRIHYGFVMLALVRVASAALSGVSGAAAAGRLQQVPQQHKGGTKTM